MLKTTESSPSLSPDWFSDCFSPKITARLGFPRLRDLPVVLPFPICGSPVSSVLAPGWRSLLPAPCNEREYLSVFAREKEGERDNFVRSYCVLGALPGTSFILYNHPERKVLSSPFTNRKMTLRGNLRHLSKLMSLGRRKAGFPNLL